MKTGISPEEFHQHCARYVRRRVKDELPMLRSYAGMLTGDYRGRLCKVVDPPGWNIVRRFVVWRMIRIWKKRERHLPGWTHVETPRGRRMARLLAVSSVTDGDPKA